MNIQELLNLHESPPPHFSQTAFFSSALEHESAIAFSHWPIRKANPISLVTVKRPVYRRFPVESFF